MRSIERNNQTLERAENGSEVSIRVEPTTRIVEYGRHFSDKHIIYSQITRKSIDVIKKFYKDEMTRDDVKLLIGLKKILNVL